MGGSPNHSSVRARQLQITEGAAELQRVVDEANGFSHLPLRTPSKHSLLLSAPPWHWPRPIPSRRERLH